MIAARVRYALLVGAGLFLIGLFAANTARAEIRVALVIGNGAYQYTTKLKNPASDAAAMATALKRLSFQVVEARDQTRSAFRQTLQAFAAQLGGADTAMLFYAGHSVQVDGENWLIPIDAKITSEMDLDLSAVPLRTVLNTMEIGAKLRLIFLDACRDNPMAVALAQGLGARSANVGRGLARVEANLGTLVAYSTQPGAVAQDGGHSPFAAALLEFIESPGMEIRQLLTRVRVKVVDETKQQQVPWDHSSLMGDFYFAAGKAGAIADAAPPSAPMASASPPSANDKQGKQSQLASLAKPDAFEPGSYQGSTLSDFAERALAAGAANDEKGEIDIASEGIGANPDDGLLYVIRGRTYAGLGMCDEALRDLKRAKDFQFTASVTWSLHYSIAACTDSEKTKIAETTAAIALFPNHPDMYALRASAYLTRREFDKALADVNQAILLEPTDAEHFALRGGIECLSRDENQGAVDIARARSMAAGDEAMLKTIAVYAEACVG